MFCSVLSSIIKRSGGVFFSILLRFININKCVFHLHISLSFEKFYNKMSKSIDQITLFHALKLRPISINEVEKWKQEIIQNLVLLNGIKPCYVQINRVNPELIVEKLSHKRALRIRKKKRCCELCIKIE